MALPLLPGFNFDKNLGKTKFHKSHQFDVANDVPMIVGQHKCGIGGARLPGHKNLPNRSQIPSGNGSALPSWVAFDKQTLSFDAYCEESIIQRRDEQHRIHKCKVYFYLEDDSIQVVETKTQNAGIPQGTIIRRHRIPKPPPNDHLFYTVEDFNVGKKLSFYSRFYSLTGCDEFTSNFIKKLGVRVGQSEKIPMDHHSMYRQQLNDAMQASRPYEKTDTLKQFLDHDKHVLRFFCYWNDKENLFGDERKMELHYFLADDTIEVKEILKPNSGRDTIPMFLRRQQLPKTVESVKPPGSHTSRTVLNVFGPTGHGGRHILDSLKTGAVNTEFYHDSDLTIGASINVWGREFIIVGCDEFTKVYYNEKYGIDSMEELRIAQRDNTPFERPVPPYNGWGSEEDSLGTCGKLLPKAPHKDFIKFMLKDRQGLNSHILRFLARMDTEKETDIDRRFIISYFLSDDTILVFEPPVRNSGIDGGRFLMRSRVKKADQPEFNSKPSVYYLAKDLYIGAVVTFNKQKFVLIDADQYALSYMQEHPDECGPVKIDDAQGTHPDQTWMDNADMSRLNDAELS